MQLRKTAKAAKTIDTADILPTSAVALSVHGPRRAERAECEVSNLLVRIEGFVPIKVAGHMKFLIRSRGAPTG